MKTQHNQKIPILLFLIPITAFAVLLSRAKPRADSENTDSLTVPVALQSMETMEASAASDSRKSGHPLIENVPHIIQTDKYPTGCESVAAVSLMQFYGIDISVEEFIDAHLPKADYPYYDDDGVMYGEDPWDAFIGDPYSSSGYGCYSTAIVKAMRSAVSEEYQIHAVYNAPLELLCSEYVDKGQPVLIWATMGMQEPYEGRTWELPSGESFTFICPEHALVLIGYDAENYYFCDAQSDTEVTAYPKEDCETAYTALEQQAIVMAVQ